MCFICLAGCQVHRCEFGASREVNRIVNTRQQTSDQGALPGNAVEFDGHHYLVFKKKNLVASGQVTL